MITIAILVVSLLAGARSHSGFECLCNINHPEELIWSCANFQGAPIGALRIPYYNPAIVFKDVDLQSPYCVPKLSNVQPQGSWVAVYYKGELGYLNKDAGIIPKVCPGYLSFNPKSLIISKQCQHQITNTPGLIVAGAPTVNPVTTKTPTTAAPTKATASPTTNNPWVHVPKTLPTTKFPWVHVPQTLPTTTKLSWVHVPQTLPTTTKWIHVPYTAGPTKAWINIPQTPTKCYGPDVESGIKNKKALFFHKTRFCPLNGASADEVTVAVFCKAPEPMNWKTGAQIQGNCNNIPKYSPVSSFSGGKSNGDGTFIFTGCTSTGNIMVVRQTCTSIALELVEITPTGDMFVIDW